MKTVVLAVKPKMNVLSVSMATTKILELRHLNVSIAIKHLLTVLLVDLFKEYPNVSPVIPILQRWIPLANA